MSIFCTGSSLAINNTC